MPDYPHYTVTRTVYDSDLDASGRMSPARICDILQCGATASAAELGVGMTDLMKEGHSWMISSMSVCFDGWPRPMDAVTLTTWPSGVRGKLICHRDYVIDAADGTRLVRATSDWIYVDVASRKICRLTPRMMELAPEGVPRADVPPAEKPPEGEGETFSAEIVVRRADCDVNRHVNNIHYIEWLLEPLSEELAARRLVRLDITYPAEARRGDVVESEARQACGGAATVHARRRAADGTALVTAVCHWA